jgi:alpha-L-rhamnosidase
MTVLTRIEYTSIEGHRDAIGIGHRRPRLTWIADHVGDDWMQAAYEIELEDADRGTRTTTGPVRSNDSVHLAWPAQFSDLVSRQRVLVRVRTWGREDTEPGPWSRRVAVEAALLDPADWRASAVSPSFSLADPPAAAPLLRRDFVVRGPVARARLYASAHGVYQTELNGCRIGDEVLAPGWTSYSHRLLYQTYDVTPALHEGPNAIGASVADGWFRGRLGFHGGKTRLYGDALAFIAQLEITYVDGTTDVVTTDAEWRCALGPIRSTGLYDGERYDARLEATGWSAPGFDDSKWHPVVVIDHDPALLVSGDAPPVRPVERLRPTSIVRASSGRFIVDFGQNISGRLRIRVHAAAGQLIRLRHAEVLEQGELSVRPLRLAAATDEYITAGRGTEEWEPRFTIHGFRYAEISGWPGDLVDGDVEAVVCHTDLRRTGWFSSSDPLVNQLHDNVVWSMRDNFVSIPTDCPQRDERLGWTGDIQVFAPTASFLYDCSGMLSSWLRDVADEQAEFGTMPHYVPWVPLIFDLEPAAVWGDAATLVPWTLHQRFDDMDLLRRQYPSMRSWVDEVAALAGESHLWDHGFQFGDWLDPAAPPDRPAQSRTDRYLVATAYHARSAQVLAEVAALLGHFDDHARYTALAASVRDAFATEFVTPSGRLSSDTQTAYALAIAFELLPTQGQRERAGRRLAELVADEGYRIATGFAGTPLVCEALSRVDAADTAYRLLLQRECPSWLYAVTMGATTMWERWDSMLPDGSVNPGAMTSFNHYALGAVADWLHGTVAGLAPAGPGFRRILVKPRPGGGLTRAQAIHDTPYGRAAVHWTRTGRLFELVVTVPPNTTAQIVLPEEGQVAMEVGSGRHTLTCKFRDPADDPG